MMFHFCCAPDAMCDSQEGGRAAGLLSAALTGSALRRANEELPNGLGTHQTTLTRLCWKAPYISRVCMRDEQCEQNHKSLYKQSFIPNTVIKQ